MLEQKSNFEKGDGVTLLMDGMIEVIGRFVRMDQDVVVLSTPRIVQLQQTENGIGMGLQQMVFTAKNSNELPINRSKILSMVPSTKEVESELIKMDSGIITGGGIQGA